MFVISPIAMGVTILWSVCLPVTFMHYAHTVKLQRYQQILPKSDRAPVDWSVGNIWWQIAAEWLEIALWSQWRAYRKPPMLLFRMVPMPAPYNLPFPANAFSGPISRHMLPPGEYDRRYRQGGCVLCWMSLWAKRCRLLPNYSALYCSFVDCDLQGGPNYVTPLYIFACNKWVHQ